MANPAKIEQFIAVTGVSENQAKFYLDSSSGDLETAVEQFYATGGAQDVPPASDNEAIEEFPPESHAGNSTCLCPCGTCSLHDVWREVRVLADPCLLIAKSDQATTEVPIQTKKRPFSILLSVCRAAKRPSPSPAACSTGPCGNPLWPQPPCTSSAPRR